MAPAGRRRDTRRADGDISALSQFLPMVAARCTNRRRPFDRPLSEAHVAALSRAGESLGARCSFLTDPAEIAAYARIVGESDRIRFLSPKLHSHLLDELRFPDADPATWDEGLAVGTLEPTSADLAKLQLLRRGDVMARLRTWGLGSALAEASRELVEASPAVCAISVVGHDNPDFVRGGQAMQRVWLKATELGVAAHPVAGVVMRPP